MSKLTQDEIEQLIVGMHKDMQVQNDALMGLVERIESLEGKFSTNREQVSSIIGNLNKAGKNNDDSIELLMKKMKKMEGIAKC